MDITIRNIPEQVYREFKQSAAANQRSLNAEVILALSAEAAERERRRQMRASRKDMEKFVAGMPVLPDSIRILRQERERREERGKR